MPGMIGTSQPCRRDPVPQPQVVLGVEEHVGDGEVRSGPALGHEVAHVRLGVGRARVLLRERGHPDAEVAGRPDQPDQLRRVAQPVGVRNPVGVRVAGRVTAQREHVAHAHRRIGPDHLPELGHRVVHRGEVADRGQRGLLGDPAGDPDRPVPGRPAGPVGHRDEGGPQRLELPDRPPELGFLGLGLGRHELERERLAAGREQVADQRRVRRARGPPGPWSRGPVRAWRARRHAVSLAALARTRAPVRAG